MNFQTERKPLRIAETVPESIVDGPGIRYVIFTQGCPHGCPGCHNPQTHDFSGGRDADMKEILAQISGNPLISGVTFSGGEPFMQAEALAPIGEEQRDLTLPYRGSANQRVIDLAKTRETGRLTLYRSDYEDL